MPIVSSTHWADGGAGAKELAETVVKTIDDNINSSDDWKMFEKAFYKGNAVVKAFYKGIAARSAENF